MKVRKLWLWLRDVVWLSVLTIGLVIASIVLSVVTVNYALAIATAISAVATAILSTRQ